MSIIFSKACEYGIQATLFIAVQDGRRVGIREIAKELGFPSHFLAKILQALSEKGVLASFKGTNGGFTLASAAESIRILDVVEAIDGLTMFETCVLGFPTCDSKHPCPVHESWGGVRGVIHGMLSKENLADLMPKSAAKMKHITGVNRKIGLRLASLAQADDQYGACVAA